MNTGPVLTSLPPPYNSDHMCYRPVEDPNSNQIDAPFSDEFEYTVIGSCRALYPFDGKWQQL